MDLALRGPGDRELGDAAIARRAASRHGVITRADALALGISPGGIEWRLRTGRWDSLHRGVYRLAGAPASWRQALLAACLAAPPAVASHRAAARLWRFPGFTTDILEITVPRDRHPRQRPGTVAHRIDLPAVDVTTVDAIPTTTAARTLIDLAAVTPAEIVEVALDDALRRGLFSMSRLRWRLDEQGRQGRAGITLMRALVAEREGGGRAPESPLETDLFRLLRRAGLPTPVVQFDVIDRGRFVARVDLAYPEHRLAIEADGFRYHGGRRAFEADRRRANELTALGWRIIRFTWEQIRRDPATVVRVVTEALEERLREPG